MLPTPSTSHVNIDRVYEPSEDSFLLMDTLSSPSEIEFLTRRFGESSAQGRLSSSLLIFEVGTGSGVVLAFVTSQAKAIFGTSDILTLGTDLNQFACSSSLETVKRYSHDAGQIASSQFLGVLQADLVSPVRPGVIDVLIFNPPYVPSDGIPRLKGECQGSGDNTQRESDSHLLSMSYEGGQDGMEITTTLLNQLRWVLNSEKGVAYVLLCQQNKPAKVINQLRNCEAAWIVDVVGRSGVQAGWEQLQILRICRPVRRK